MGRPQGRGWRECHAWEVAQTAAACPPEQQDWYGCSQPPARPACFCPWPSLHPGLSPIFPATYNVPWASCKPTKKEAGVLVGRESRGSTFQIGAVKGQWWQPRTPRNGVEGEARCVVRACSVCAADSAEYGYRHVVVHNIRDVAAGLICARSAGRVQLRTTSKGGQAQSARENRTEYHMSRLGIEAEAEPKRLTGRRRWQKPQPCCCS